MNPLLAPSPFPLGYPDFDQIAAAHFAPAFDAAFRAADAAIVAIVADDEPASFANTIVALERATVPLDRVSRVFYGLYSAHTNDELDALAPTVSTRLAALSDAIHFNPALAARVAAVADDPGAIEGEEAKRLAQRYVRNFRRAGAHLDPAAQARLAGINTELAALTTRYSAAVRAGATPLVITDPAELDGLSAAEIAALAVDDHFELPMLSPTVQPALAKLTDPLVRERLWKLSLGRGGPPVGQSDEGEPTGPLVVAIAALRAERAQLLGYRTHADYITEVETAGSADAVRGLLDRLIPAAVSNAAQEAKELAELAEADELDPWDLPHLAERLRAERFSLDTAELANYFELNRALVDGVFYAARLLYGITVTERFDLPKYHPDVRTFDIADGDGAVIGIFVFDPFARPSKRGGAWMTSFVDQSHLLGTKPVVVNVLNVTKPAPAADGSPGVALLSLDEITTLFHEFGHGLHGLLSDVTYPTFSGTNVPRDFVEYPSQLNEMWALHPQILANYAKHVGTGEELPAELLEAIDAEGRFGQGYATTEYLAASALDQAWHSLTHPVAVDDVDEFERQALRRAGIDPEAVPPRYRSTYFSHIFAGGYSAGYYSYIWSEVLDADTVEWFKANGGATRANGDAFRTKLLGVGGSKDPLAAFADVVGRAPDIGPLLRRRGLDRG